MQTHPRFPISNGFTKKIDTMMRQNRRKRYVIDKSLQFRYLAYLVATLTIVSAAGVTGTYFGIWASVIKAFSEESIRETMITAAQISEYGQARRPHSYLESNTTAGTQPTASTQAWFSIPTLRLFRETELFSERQKEVLQQILNDTHCRLIGLGIALFLFIGWGSLFLTHQIAGPLFRLRRSFEILKNGDLTDRIRLRRFDEAKDVARHFNDMIGKFDASVSKIKMIARKSAFQELEKELARFKTTADQT